MYEKLEVNKNFEMWQYIVKLKNGGHTLFFHLKFYFFL